ncbi:TPA: hypothetical protein ENS27_10740 [bacterium]|nr:hypothetical protein [bacterium]
MNSKDEITKALSALTKRINTYTIIKYISLSLYFGICILLITIIASKFTPIPLISSIILAIFLSFIIGFFIGIKRRITILDSARIADKKLNLGDRLASAIELINGKIKPSAMSDLQLNDTNIYAKNLDPKTVFPHIVPLITKFLPIMMIMLLLLLFIPIQYGESKEILQVLNQIGMNIERSAKEIDKEYLSENMSKLITEAEKLGSDIQKKKLSGKEALSNISDLNRKFENVKLLNELSNNLKDEITPEKRLLLKELLDKLSENIRDFPEMNEFEQKIKNVQQSNFSNEAIKELIKSLDEKRLAPADISALQKISSELKEGKQEITTAFRTQSNSNQVASLDQKGITRSGEGSPSNESMKNTESEVSKRLNKNNNGQKSELDGKISTDGSIIPSESSEKFEKGISTVPYEKIYFEYRESADDTIARSTIPRVYKEQVKRYFDAIKPKESN